MDLALAAMHPMGGEVEPQVVEAQQLLGEGRAHPAQHGADARDQLGRRERLADEVVGTGVEAAQPVGLLAARGQHDDRQMRGVGAAPQPAADLEAGELRQHPVEQEQVGLPLLDQGHRLLAVERLGDGEAGRLQIVGEQLLQRRLVLDDQDQRLHGVVAPRRGWSWSPWTM